MPNPYDPQNPANPQYFGGRKEMLKISNERLEKAVRQRQSGGILAYGYRGSGKTSLLRKIASIVEPDESAPNNVISTYRRLSRETNETELYQVLVEDTIDKVNRRKNLIQKLISNYKAKSIAVPSILEIEIENINDIAGQTPYHKFKTILNNINNADYLLIQIDDADYLTKNAIGELKTISEEQGKTPIVLVISGGIEFEQRLVNEYSPVSRIFSGASFNLGAFKREETQEVLENPLANEDTRWSGEGIDKVHELSGGYPYLVQCIAHASYEEHTQIGKDKVTGQLQNALSLGKPWLSHTIETASDEDIRCFLRVINLNKLKFTSAEMTSAGVASPYIGRLVKLKIIDQISRGRYQLVQPPIIAYYHALERGIEV